MENDTLIQNKKKYVEIEPFNQKQAKHSNLNP